MVGDFLLRETGYRMEAASSSFDPFFHSHGVERPIYLCAQGPAALTYIYKLTNRCASGPLASAHPSQLFGTFTDPNAEIMPSSVNGRVPRTDCITPNCDPFARKETHVR